MLKDIFQVKEWQQMEMLRGLRGARSGTSMNMQRDCLIIRASPVAQMVKNLPAMKETRVPSLGQGDPLEKWMATHSSILAWRIPWTEESGGLQSMGLQSQTQLSDTLLLQSL